MFFVFSKKIPPAVTPAKRSGCNAFIFWTPAGFSHKGGKAHHEAGSAPAERNHRPRNLSTGCNCRDRPAQHLRIPGYHPFYSAGRSIEHAGTDRIRSAAPEKRRFRRERHLWKLCRTLAKMRHRFLNARQDGFSNQSAMRVDCSKGGGTCKVDHNKRRRKLPQGSHRIADEIRPHRRRAIPSDVKPGFDARTDGQRFSAIDQMVRSLFQPTGQRRYHRRDHSAINGVCVDSAEAEHLLYLRGILVGCAERIDCDRAGYKQFCFFITAE